MTATVLGPLSAGLINVVAQTASVVTLLCVGPLVVLTLQGRARPSPVTWSIWAAVGLVATVAMAAGGAPVAAWLEKGALSLGPVAVAAAAAYKGEPWSADRADRIGLYFGSLGTVVYVVALFQGAGASEAGLVAVGTAMVVDAVGAVPTWAKAWRNPYDELILTYALALASVVAVLAVLPWPWTWLAASYLLFLALQMASLIVVFAWARLRQTSAAGSEH